MSLFYLHVFREGGGGHFVIFLALTAKGLFMDSGERPISNDLLNKEKPIFRTAQDMMDVIIITYNKPLLHKLL